MSVSPLNRMLEEAAWREPEKLLFRDAETGVSLTVREAWERIRVSGEKLKSAGIRAGDPVALPAACEAAAAVGMLALRRVGAACVLLHPRISPEEQLREAGIQVRAIYDPRKEELRLSDASVPAVRGAFAVFTSGSTGKPKGVLLTEESMIANLQDSLPLGCYEKDDIALCALPLHHVFGLVLTVGAVALGYGVCFTRQKDPAALLHVIEEQRITRMNGVPSQYFALAEQCAPRQARSLRAGFIGGGPASPEQLLWAESRLGMKLIPVYGMSEFIGISCADGREDAETRLRGVGRFYAMNRGVILREDGKEAAPGEEGELCVDGPAKMRGYLGEKEISADLWHTGDLGFLDRDGILHLTGRKKETIIRNGENLSVRKIEEALGRVPGVKDAAVIPIGDPKEGEIPGAMVVCNADVFSALPDALKGTLRTREIPVKILRAETIPHTETGKPDRRRIREVLEAWSG